MRRPAALLALLLLLAGCAVPPEQGTAPPSEPELASRALSWEELEPERELELAYAREFSVTFCTGGYAKITVGADGNFLLVPQGAEVPEGVPEEVTVLQQPLDRIYLVATSAMDLFRALDAIDAVTLSGTDAEGWYIPEARQAMEEGRILYAGKYSAPDYERIVDQGCDLAVESTMIYHTPEVREQLERFGIPVLVERSSYESHPLGRMEWLKLYGVLLGREDRAREWFDGQMERLEPVLKQAPTGQTAAFFYITSNGAVNVRKPGDYVAEAIRLAGGSYVLSDLPEDENDLATMNLQMEAFYERAREADVLIYNSSIEGELSSLSDLLEKSALLADFQAVKTGNVWCTGQNLFQESLGLGDLILDLNAVFTAEHPEDLELTYLHRLEGEVLE